MLDADIQYYLTCFNVSAELMKSKFVCRPSICPFVALIISEPVVQISFKLTRLPGVFLILEKTSNFQFFVIKDFFPYSLTWDPIGMKISKRLSFDK